MINTGGNEQVTIEQLQQRITELEGQIKDQCNIEMDMAKEIGEFYQKIERLDVALAEIEKAAIMPANDIDWLQDRVLEIITEARAGE